MSNISAKKLHFETVKLLLDSLNDSKDLSLNGVLLITNSSIVFGKLRTVNIKTPGTNVTDILMSSRKKVLNKAANDGNTLIGDGTSIVIEDATIKYSNNMTLNMKEIILFTDQIVGYYPVDLTELKNQFSLE